MSSKSPRPRINAPGNLPPGASLTFLQQNNQYFSQPSLPNAEKLEKMRRGAPEVYAAFVQQFELDAAHTREMQARALAIDEVAIPALTMNDRLGIFAAWTATLAVVGTGFYCAKAGIEWGWLIALVGGLPQLVWAFRNRTRG